MEQARKLCSQHRFVEAVRVCRLGLLGQPGAVEGRLVLGRALGALARYDEVLAEMRAALEIDPNNAMARFFKGEALFFKGEHAQAEEELTRAQAVDAGLDGLSTLLEQVRAARQDGPSGGQPRRSGFTKVYPASVPPSTDPMAVAAPVEQQAYTDFEEEDATQVDDGPRWFDGAQLGGRSAGRGEPAGSQERAREHESLASVLVTPVVVVGSGKAAGERRQPWPETVALTPTTIDETPAAAVGPAVTLPLPRVTRDLGGPPRMMPAARGDSQPPPLPPVTAAAAPGELRPLSSGRDERVPIQAVQPAFVDSESEESTSPIDVVGELAGAPAAGSSLQAEPLLAADDRRPPAPPIGVEPAHGTGHGGWPQPARAGESMRLRASAPPRLGSPDALPLDTPGFPEEQPEPTPVEAPSPAELTPVEIPVRGTPRSPAASLPEPERRRPLAEQVSRRQQALEPARASGVLASGEASVPERGAQWPTLVGAGTSAAPPSTPAWAGQAEAADDFEWLADLAAEPALIASAGSAGVASTIGPAGLAAAGLTAAVTVPTRPGAWQRRVLRATLAMVCILAAVGIGLGLRSYRTRQRALAQARFAESQLASGTFAGFLAADRAYRAMVEERPDDVGARTARARLRACMALEFGEPPAEAATLIDQVRDGPAGELAIARAYLALAEGDLDGAQREAAAAQTLVPGDPTPQYLLARALLLADDGGAAAAELQQFLRRMPDHVFALRALGQAEALRRNDEAALEAWAAVLARSPEQVGAAIDRAHLLAARRKKLDGAERAAGQALQRPPGQLSRGERAWAQLALARVHLARSNYGFARDRLQQAAAAPPEGDLRFADAIADAYLEAEEVMRASEISEAAVRRAPTRPSSHLRLAAVFALEGRPREALAELNSAGRGAGEPEAFLWRGLARLSESRLAEARKDLELAVSRAPDLFLARLALFRVEVAQGRWARALDGLRRLDGVDVGRNAWVLETEGLAYLARGDIQAARARLRAAVVANGSAFEAHYQLARLAQRDGRLADAEAELRAALASNAGYRLARRELAQLLLDAGDALRAREQFEILLRDPAPSVEALLGAARACAQSGDQAAAEAHLRTAAARGAPAAMLARERARLALQRGRFEETIALLGGHQLAGEVEGKGLLAEAHAGLGDVDKAAALVREILRADSRGWRALIAAGRAQVLLGDLAAATRSLEAAVAAMRAARRGPQDLAEALGLLGQAQYYSGALAAALATLSEAVRLGPHRARAHYFLGLVHDEQQHLAEARASFERAIAEDPRFADAHYQLGEVLRRSGDGQAAARALASYLKVAPDGDFAGDARSRLAELEKK